jgi:hypothetical protein
VFAANGASMRARSAGTAILGMVVLLGAGSTAAGAPTDQRVTAVSAAATPGANSTPTLPITPGPGPGVTNGPIPRVPGRSTLRASQVIQLPSARRCVTRLRIGLAHPKSVHLRTLSVHVGRRHLKRSRVPSSLTIRVLPKGHFTLKVTVTTTASLVLTRSRRYDRCG